MAKASLGQSSTNALRFLVRVCTLQTRRVFPCTKVESADENLRLLRRSPIDRSDLMRKQSSTKPAVPDNPRLWDRNTTRAFFGGIDVSTLYRGMAKGRYPRPVFVSANVVRWLADECETALDRMIAERNEPMPPQRRGRPARRNAAKTTEDA
jgi:predicted DNA-binding transcriptional regulator AlpA